MEFISRTAKYTWQDYETNEDILSELKINPFVKKIRSYRNKWIQHVRCVDRDRVTATLNYEVSTVWETKRRTASQKALC
jgi:hypothetical protein